MLGHKNCIRGQKWILVCILPHCRLTDWCGNLRNDSGHVIWCLHQSASFRIFNCTFYFPHSAIPHFTQYPVLIMAVTTPYLQ